jgi:hypothetical protein
MKILMKESVSVADPNKYFSDSDSDSDSTEVVKEI